MNLGGGAPRVLSCESPDSQAKASLYSCAMCFGARLLVALPPAIHIRLMPKDKPEQDKKAVRVDEVELVPDAWERFEKAVDKVAKSPPQHRSKPPDLQKCKDAKP